MVKGLYTAHSAMINEQHRMDTLTNNLANVATTGYKKRVLHHRPLQMRWQSNCRKAGNARFADRLITLSLQNYLKTATPKMS